MLKEFINNEIKKLINEDVSKEDIKYLNDMAIYIEKNSKTLKRVDPNIIKNISKNNNISYSRETETKISHVGSIQIKRAKVPYDGNRFDDIMDTLIKKIFKLKKFNRKKTKIDQIFSGNSFDMGNYLVEINKRYDDGIVKKVDLDIYKIHRE